MNERDISIRTPKTEEEFRRYYQVRYETLRQPWGDVEGSERETDDAEAVHRMMVDAANDAVIGVARLHFNTPDEAQIRLMAIREDYRKQDLGRRLMVEMEAIARDAGANKVILHARDYAVGFYEKLGYVRIEPSYLLMGQIQHFLMEKPLS